MGDDEDRDVFTYGVPAAPAVRDVERPASRYDRPNPREHFPQQLGGLRRDPERHLAARHYVVGVTTRVPVEEPHSSLTQRVLRPIVRPGDKPVERHRESRSYFAHVYTPFLAAGWYLLHTPAVAVRVAEEDAPHVIQGFASAGRAVCTFIEDQYLADLHASFGKVGAGGEHIRDDQERAIYGAGLHFCGTRSQVDRASRSGWGQLDEADVFADPVVYVQVEPDLLPVEVYGAIEVRDRDRNYLYLPIHDVSPYLCFLWKNSASTGISTSGAGQVFLQNPGLFVRRNNPKANRHPLRAPRR